MYFDVRILFLGIVLSIANNGVLGAYFYEPDARGWINVYRIAANFNEAKETCQSEGAILAAPTTQGLAKTMKELIAFNGFTSSFYIDAAQYTPGVFSSSQNVSLADMYLDGKTANLDYSKGDCVALSPSELSVVPCNTPLNYMCYKKDDRSPQMVQCNTEDAGYKFYKETGSCYKLNSTYVTWAEANATCTSEGNHLAILNDATEAKTIASMKFPTIGPYVPFLIIGVHGLPGARTFDEYKQWLYVDGTPVDKLFDHWYSFTPSESDRRCGALSEYGVLVDLYCYQKFGFLCERNP